jgi:hypothetical protein
MSMSSKTTNSLDTRQAHEKKHRQNQIGDYSDYSTSELASKYAFPLIQGSCT